MIFALILAALPLNTVSIGSGATLCSEANKCVITAVSNHAAQLYFGVAATYCATPLTLNTLPLAISYSTPNPVLCPSDPAPGVVKQLAGQQLSTAYTVTYTLNGVLQPIFTVPAIAPKVQNCTGTLTTDSTSAQTLNLTCKVG